jgi:hypothetical protein
MRMYAVLYGSILLIVGFYYVLAQLEGSRMNRTRESSFTCEDPLTYLPRKPVQEFAKRRVIYDPQQPSDHLYVVILGRVKPLCGGADHSRFESFPPGESGPRCHGRRAGLFPGEPGPRRRLQLRNAKNWDFLPIMPRERGTSSALGPAESRPHALLRGAVEVILFAGGISVRMAEDLHNGAEDCAAS